MEMSPGIGPRGGSWRFCAGLLAELLISSCELASLPYLSFVWQQTGISLAVDLDESCLGEVTGLDDLSLYARLDCDCIIEVSRRRPKPRAASSTGPVAFLYTPCGFQLQASAWIHIPPSLSSLVSTSLWGCRARPSLHNQTRRITVVITQRSHKNTSNYQCP